MSLDAAVCAALALLAVSACGRSAKPGEAADAGPDLAGYLPPPTLTAAIRGAGGVETLSGTAPDGAEVRLRDPDGGAFSATANDDGAWSMQLPAAAAPRMFAFEGDASGRMLHGEGAIIALPAPGPVATLARAGYGALPIGVGPGALSIDAIDYDGAGGGAVSGVTGAHAAVRFLLDGKPVGEGQADDQGRFAVLDLSARRPFGLGTHQVRIESQIGSAAVVAAQTAVTVTPAARLDAVPFRVTRDGDAWRADWRTPGGGVQTTLVFDTVSTEAPLPETKS